jgi:deoxyribodipyrimidine photolyase-related protein
MATFLFPNQLFTDALSLEGEIFLVEHPLFFTQLPFHKQKLMFHHVTLCVFQDAARAHGHACTIISLKELEQKPFVELLTELGCDNYVFYEPRDDFLSRELRQLSKIVAVTIQTTPAFLTKIDDWNSYRGAKKTLRMQDFYQWQRRRLGILMDGDAPAGGVWSLDTENRKSIPASVTAPPPFVSDYSEKHRQYIAEAIQRFPQQPGSDNFLYPVSHSQAAEALAYFLTAKLAQFGDYEDAVRASDPVLFHSQLSPLLNSGLLTPQQVLEAVLHYAETTTIPLNSLEGFLRQLIGWREFICLTYLTHGRTMRTSNALAHHNPIPTSFWNGTTGLLPLDHTIQEVLATGYAHHIERLMILGVFLLLTETEPTESFNWFFSLFIDAYDWVMVPNVYAMSQYADGGLITTKPYLCGSAYLRKMTDFPKGEWCAIWDAIYWRWVSRHQPLLQRNPRTSMSVAMWNKWSPEKQGQLLSVAETFLATYYA